MNIDFCIPVYNEEVIFDANSERIWQFLQKAALPYDWRLVFIVNGSLPAFVAQVQKFVAIHQPQITCLVIPEAGKGRAIKAYFNISNADILVYMDIDLAVGLEALSRLVSPVIHGEADLVFGSRMLPLSVRSRSRLRESSSRAYLIFSRWLLKHRFSDLQCGFKAIRASVWQQISPLIKNNAWFFDTELIYYAQKSGFTLQEIAVDWSENRYSTRHSKIKMSDAWRFITETIALRRRA
jgi:glycosyltransferase involved in cell wall biosynthesis